MFFGLKERITGELSNAYAVALTTDAWTSRSNESHNAITVHWIYEDGSTFILKSSLLSCSPYDQRHTANNLSKLLKSEVASWKLANKTICIVSDNAANMSAAIKMANFQQVGCFAHTLATNQLSISRASSQRSKKQWHISGGVLRPWRAFGRYKKRPK